jgi:UDP-glucose 4-epimerase
MKTALITGVSGYLGSHLAKALKKDGWKVVGLDIHKRKEKSKYVDEFFHYDLAVCNLTDFEFFERHDFDVVFHLAGKIDVAESVVKPIEYFNVNTAGTINLLDVMDLYGVENIIFSSTAAMYCSSDELLRETDQVNPHNNPYAASKYAAELAITQSKMNHVIFRYFNLAGADPEGEMGERHDPETHLIPKIFQNLNNFFINGKDYSTLDGTCIRDYVHVSDVADAHVAAANYLFQGKKSCIMNLGTEKGYSIKEIINLVENVTGEKVNYTYKDRRQGDPAHLVADSKLANKYLNFQPKHDIISIIKTAYEWHLKHGTKN